MTAAPESVKCLALGGRATPVSGLGDMLRRWERVLVVLAICLPVPVLAATGLSVPLPATVERLAAALVPWAGSARLEANESLIVGADGAIVLARHELAGLEAGGQPTSLADATPVRSSGDTPQVKDGDSKGGETATSGETDGTSSGPADDGSTGGGSGGGVSSGGSGGGGSSSGGSGGGGSSSGDSGGNSDPVQGVVDQAGSATQPVVDGVEDTVDDPAGTVGGVLEDAGEAAGGVLPVAGP
jgi:hypothetical protein